MEYRPFGRTGLDVSAIGFGCWELGGSYGHFDEGEVIAAIHKAMDLGINCFDTAEGYGMGKSEALLARGLGDRRKDVIVVTKVGIGYQDSGREKNRDSRPERIMTSVESSLMALDTDYIDVYLIHWPDRYTPFDETMKTLDDLVDQGKVRFVGLSNFKAEEMAECMETRRVDVGQYGYHMFDRRMEKDVFPYCQEHGVGMMGYGSLAHGLLTGAFDKTTTFDEGDWRSRGGLFNMPLFSEENFPKNLNVVSDLAGIARDMGKEMYHLALRWVLSNPTLSVALVGARKPEEVEANMGALGWSLSEAELTVLDAAFDRYGVDTRPDVWVE
ncbi:MAG: aldo/keto reductase [bacterium]|nr:aldo/keto reductase [bacterium]